MESINKCDSVHGKLTVWLRRNGLVICTWLCPAPHIRMNGEIYVHAGLRIGLLPTLKLLSPIIFLAFRDIAPVTAWLDQECEERISKVYQIYGVAARFWHFTFNQNWACLGYSIRNSTRVEKPTKFINRKHLFLIVHRSGCIQMSSIINTFSVHATASCMISLLSISLYNNFIEVCYSFCIHNTRPSKPSCLCNNHSLLCFDNRWS